MTGSIVLGRRNVLRAAAASAFVLGTAACTTGGGAADGTVTLKFLSHYGQPPMSEGMTKLVDQWNAENPDIQVKQQTVSFDELLTTLNVRQTGGQGADVFSAYSLWGGQLAANGVLDKVPDEMATDITTNYSTAAAESVTGGDGTVFGYPTELNTYVLYYNTELLSAAGYDEAPKTWDELREAAEKLTKKDGSGNYQVVGLSLIQDGDNKTAHPFLALLDSADGQFLDGSGASALDDKAKKLLEMYSELAASGATTNSIEPTKSFRSGQVAMAIQAGWWVGSLKTQMKDEYSTVATAPVPGPNTGDQGSLAYSFFTGVNANSKHKSEAWKFVSWLNSQTNDEGVSLMGDFMASNGLIPPRKEDAKILGPKLAEEDANLKAIYGAADYAMAESNVANAYQAKTTLHTKLDEVIVNGADPDSVFSALVDELNKK